MRKAKKCKACKQPFEPWNTLQKACSPKCAIELVNEDKKKEARKKKKEFYENDRSWQLQKTQQIFNRYIRERDKNEQCISCGRDPKKRNAGHYRTVGSYPELRFHIWNCHLQCEHCNTYRSGNLDEYRRNLIRKIGQRNVDWLEGPHQAQNWTIEDIIEIKEYYREQLRRLKHED